MKASPLLRAWLARLADMSVELVTRSRWIGWNGDTLVFETPSGRSEEHAEIAIFALGGASWSRLGSDGGWREAFAARGAGITPLKPSNSGFIVAWSDVFRSKFAGEPLKSAKFSFDGHEIRGEAIVTRYGVEGGAIYALSSRLRDAIEAKGSAILELDLMPDLAQDTLAAKLSGGAKDSMANRLRKAGLPPVAASLVREYEGGPALPAAPGDLARRIKNVRIRLDGVAPIERAISTAGGVTWDSLNPDFSLKTDAKTFVCGEMLDWEAPTGGYLLQACLATGRAAAEGALKRIGA
jgi:uncharacterized flavoprotein (TIGR03862 family)